MANSIKKVTVNDGSLSTTNNVNYNLNNSSKVDTIDLSILNNNEYVSKSDATNMLENKMNEIANANQGMTLIKSAKGVETDSAGHHYLTFTLKDTSGNSKTYTYRINGDNTLQNTVHYEEYADGTHTRWREGMNVDSNIKGFTKADATAFKNSGNSASLSSSTAKTTFDKLIENAKANGTITNKGAITKDNSGSFHQTFTIKSATGKISTYEYKLDSNDKLTKLSKKDENSDGTYTLYDYVNNEKTTTSLIANTSDYNLEKTNLTTGKTLYKTKVHNLTNTKSTSASSIKSFAESSDSKTSVGAKSYPTSISAATTTFQNNAAIKNLKAQGYTIKEGVKLDSGGRYRVQYSHTSSTGTEVYRTYVIDKSGAVKEVENKTTNKAGTYIYNNYDQNITINHTVNSDGSVYEVKKNIKTGKVISTSGTKVASKGTTTSIQSATTKSNGYPSSISEAAKLFTDNSAIKSLKAQGYTIKEGTKLDSSGRYRVQYSHISSTGTEVYRTYVIDKSGAVKEVENKTTNKAGTYVYNNYDQNITINHTVNNDGSVYEVKKNIKTGKVISTSGTKKASTTKTSTSSSSSKTSTSSSDSAKAQNIISNANSHVGGKYSWGGNNYATGVDCSHFVNKVLNESGINVPYLTSGGWASGGAGKSFQKVSGGAANAKPGDIICSNGHVAILGNNGNLIEAQSEKAGVTNTRKMKASSVIAVYRYVG